MTNNFSTKLQMRFASHGAGSEGIFSSADTDLIIFKYGTRTKVFFFGLSVKNFFVLLMHGHYRDTNPNIYLFLLNKLRNPLCEYGSEKCKENFGRS